MGMRQLIKEISGLRSTGCFDKYLGLPTLVGRQKNSAFKGIIDRIWGKLNSWQSKFSSEAGKEILLKAVIQALPTLCMGLFRLQKTLCHQITNMMQNCFWGHHDSSQKIHWLSCKKICISKKSGGLGFQGFGGFYRYVSKAIVEDFATTFYFSY
ncbi:hypothetical protein F2P56_013557 [Juglans regia]|uniref:Uncharacterized protein n=2 Tax=Juglans regia TaxID=51240 RepID=A0A834CYD1_JUGRE|nr:uncharacterized protein LOC109021514 [Juglans regia]KAF5469490.1 hypothetical protein F2P56_013557 [Juglans regia]